MTKKILIEMLKDGRISEEEFRSLTSSKSGSAETEEEPLPDFTALYSQPEEVIKGFVDVLLSKTGKRLLVELLIQSSTLSKSDTTVLTWSQNKLKPIIDDNPDYKIFLSKHLKPLAQKFLGSGLKRHFSGVANQRSPSLSSIAGALNVLREGGNLPAQVLEIIDDSGLLTASQLEGALGSVPTDGLVAAFATLIISSGLQYSQYRKGAVRWDDAIDKVVGDASKAGLTGLILSAIVSGLALPSAGAGIAVGLVLAPLVYSIVSTFCDWAYDQLLGGQHIREARLLHADYLHTAKYIQSEIIPRIEEMRRLGDLVDSLGNIELGDSQEQDMLVTRAAKSLQQFLGTGAVVVLGHTELSSEKYEERVLRFVQSRIKANNPKKPANINSLPLNLIHFLMDKVSATFWQKHRLGGKFERMNPNDVWNTLKSELKSATGDREQTLGKQQFVNYLTELENRRDEQDSLIPFKVTGPGLSDDGLLVWAYDILELVHILYALEKLPWHWQETPSLPGPFDAKALGPKGLEHYTKKHPIGPYYDPDVGVRLNPHVSKGIYEDLRAGRHRLFRYKLPGPDGARMYLSAPATNEPPENQCNAIRQSLKTYHHDFRNKAFLDTLEPLGDIEAFLRQGSSEALFTLLGVRLTTLDLYTATMEFEQNLGAEARRLPFEGYFNSIEEAQKGFKGTSKNFKGVRPGGLLLPPRLRERLQDATPEKFWTIQNALLGQIAEGIFVLDAMANKDESRLANLSGMGVIASWWWSLTGRTRIELKKLLQDALVQQALRVELMETLLAIQRIHTLSHDMFKATLNQRLAIDVANQDKELRLSALKPALLEPAD